MSDSDGAKWRKKTKQGREGEECWVVREASSEGDR